MKNLLAAQGFSSQPRGLYSLFLVELWERFGFYAVQGVLVLYLTKAFHLPDAVGYEIFAIASAFMYATPFIGGFIADKILGYRMSVLFGAVLMGMGYWLLIVPGLHVFYWAIALIVIGNGFFKSCISTLVGLLYDDEEDDPRRDAGYTIFYMGINIGSFIGPLMSGYVSQQLGWTFAFGFTGAGLFLAFFIALLTFRKLGTKGLPPVTEKIPFLWWKLSPKICVYVGAIFGVLMFGWLMKNHHLANILFTVICFGCVLGILYLALRCEGQERNNMLILIMLLVFSIIFWAIYNQTFSSLNLFTDRIVDRHVLGFTIPTAWFQAVNPFFIIALTPFFVRFWPYVDANKLWLSSGAAKFSLALFLIGLGYLLLVTGIYMHAPDGTVHMFWLNTSYLFQTFGELCLSPIGLSLVSELAPVHYRGMMMGAWMLSISAGFSVGDYLSQFSNVPDSLLNAPVASIEHFYAHAFTIFMILALVAGFLLWMLTPVLNKMLPASHKGTNTQ